MVNNGNVSCYQGAPPLTEDEAARKIPGGPLYGCDALRTLLESGTEGLVAWTKKCTDDLQKYELDLNDVLELCERCLSRGRFLGSEWCKQKPTGPWAACDAYQVHRSEWIEHAHKEMRIEYYLKFGISKTGVLILMASCHPSEDRN